MLDEDRAAFACALLHDVPEHGWTRGEIGTVVEHLSDGICEALLDEFADSDGQAYAIAELTGDDLILLHRRHADAA